MTRKHGPAERVRRREAAAEDGSTERRLIADRATTDAAPLPLAGDPSRRSGTLPVGPRSTLPRAGSPSGSEEKGEKADLAVEVHPAGGLDRPRAPRAAVAMGQPSTGQAGHRP